ncbi:hypothetical protein CRG98_024908 [Punica granatum]|uniref:Uncharacterized protein n=1 Tax=Punica granatum TaxID=22663 RepID=A0A2I0JEN0_PUNGR|nr:hypothetical protein CRG98_024908 [Punica granatum]
MQELYGDPGNGNSGRLLFECSICCELRFAGPISTLKVFEDFILVKELVRTKGQGRVLVVDGEGSQRCAVLGGELCPARQQQRMGRDRGLQKHPGCGPDQRLS